jgi:hypothetical protein
MNTNAICLITFRPNEIYLNFLHTFSNYDIYVIIDDNEDNFTQFKTKYTKINFVQLNNNVCTNSGYKNTNFIGIKKIVSGWDKALYFFSYMQIEYNFIWFIEDDVYFKDEKTLMNIDKKYVDHDILCNSSFEQANLNEWLWNIIKIQFQPPYYCGMMCIVRFSKNMIESIKDYAKKYNTLFFLEALFPTLAVKDNLKYIPNPCEFNTVTHRNIFDIYSLNDTNLYHPFKNINNHIKARNKI